MSSLKDEMLIKSKPAWKLKDVNSIIESFEYFCQMSWKSIVIILSYAVSNLLHFCYKTQYSSAPARSVSGFLASNAVQKVYNNIIDVATTAKKNRFTTTYFRPYIPTVYLGDCCLAYILAVV